MGVTWGDHHLDVAGVRVHLRRAGPDRADGDPVIVLHDGGADTVDAPAWALVADALPVVQVLLPGVGRSTAPPPAADLAWVTGLLAEVVRRCGAEPPVLVGTSLGGWFAIETALAHPDAVARLVLCDTAGLHSPPGYLFGLFTDGQGQAGHDGLLGPLMDRHGAGRSPAALHGYAVDLTAAALGSWNPHAPDPGLLARARRLTTPTTILWGARDALIPLAHARALADAIGGEHGGAVVVCVPGAGHLLAVDAPEVVAGQVTGTVLRSPRCPSTPTA